MREAQPVATNEIRSRCGSGPEFPPAFGSRPGRMRAFALPGLAPVADRSRRVPRRGSASGADPARLLDNGSTPGARRRPEPLPPGAGETPQPDRTRARRPARARRVGGALLPALAAIIAVSLSVQGHAQTSVPHDWGLKPSGLGTGDEFRLLIVVSNLGQTPQATTTSYVVGTIGALQFTPAQQFTTGDNAGGYELSSIQLYIRSFDSTDSARVSIYEANASGNPDSSRYTLTNPASITNDTLNTFTAPAGATLENETKYFVVLEATVGLYSAGMTASNGEDAGAATGWSIANDLRWRNMDTAAWSSDANALKIAIKGTLPTPPPDPTVVPANWSLIPTGLATGDQFRLIFLSSVKPPGLYTNIAIYNANMQSSAAAGHTDIQTYSDGFRAVGCTEDDDAVDNTHTIGSGVPIHWLDGNKVADDYADFYDGDWDDEVNNKNELGANGPDTSQSSNYPFTGCDHDGTEAFNSTSESQALGVDGGNVRLGRPNSTASGDGPLSSGNVVTWVENRPMYGLSAVFKVVAASSDATLSALVVNDGTNDLTLDPTFAPGTFDYDAEVANAVTTAMLTATVNDANASVTGVTLGGTVIAYPSLVVGDAIIVAALVEGGNAIVVTVTAEDTSTQDYTVTVTRPRRTTTTPTPPGEVEVPNAWSLIPTGVGAGEKFRLLFLSSTTIDGTSYDIADYNTFVQDRAAAGHADVRAYSDGFRAVGCTPDSDATANTGATGTGVPIHWLDGNKVADDYADFYDGDWDEERHDQNKNELGENGPDTSVVANYPLTGCGDDGTEAFNGTTSEALGAPGGTVRVARPDSSSSGHGPIGSNQTTADTSTRPMYGLSQAFVVAAAATNTAPVFMDGAGAMRDFDETIGDTAVATASNIGLPVTATDADTDTLTYSHSGADAAKFGLIATNGQIRTKVGEKYDYETATSYAVTVKVVDGHGGEATVDVAIGVTNDTTEVPLRPAAPTVDRILGNSNELLVYWNEPSNTGRPDISSYTLRYQKSGNPSTRTTLAPLPSLPRSGSLTDLDPGTLYQVGVQATNADGDGPWSGFRTASTPDLPDMWFDRNSITVEETDGMATLTVNIAPPSSNGSVSVDYATSDGSALEGEDYDETLGTLTLPEGETSGVIEVEIEDDRIHEGVESFFVTLSNASRAELPADNVAQVEINSEDPVPVATIANVSVLESADTMTMALVLDRPSDENIRYRALTAAVSGTATATDDYVDFAPATVDVLAGVQSGTLAIDIVDDAAAESVETIVIVWRLDTSLGEATPSPLTFTGSIRDNDTAGVTVSETSLTVTEEDTAGDTYTVVLSSQPTADVTVTVAGHTGTDVTPTPASLTFAGTTWNTAQTVTVTAGNDADTTNDTVTLTHGAASTDSDYGGIAIADVAVTVEDNDTAQVTGVMVESGNAQLVVGWDAVGNATGYRVQWKSGGQSYNAGDRQAMIASGSTTRHTIASLMNGTEYTLRVRAVRTGANRGPWSDDATGTPEVPTAPGVTLSKSSLTVTEEDATGDTYTLVLNTQPTANVVVTIAGHAGTDVIRTPASLTFTTVDWGTARTVTVTAGDDADTADDTATLTHGAASADSDYGGIAIADVAVTVRDNDTAKVTGVTIAPDNAQLAVGWTAVGNATGYRVQWKSGGQSYNAGDRQAMIGSGSTTGHTIGSLMNGTEYTVRVIAVRSGAEDGPPSDDATGTPEAPTAPGVTVSRSALTVTEQDATGDAYTLVLDTRPTARVTVTVAGHAGTDVTPSPTALTFTTGDWGTPRTVTVTAGDDADAADDAATLTHGATSADAGYDGIAIAGVAVTVRDDDTANNAPVFDDGAATTRSFAETIGAATVGASVEFGTPVTATDGDGDTPTYGMAGTDAARFGVDASTGRLRRNTGESYDHETRASYEVTVTADDGNGGTASIEVTIVVDDEAEAPPAPAAPTVTAVGTTGLAVAWSAPDNAGRPAIADYDLRRRAPGGAWTDGPQDIAGTAASIADLAPGTEYEVQARATNADGDGPWSAAGSGTTGGAAIRRVHLFASAASDPRRQGFVRVVNHATTTDAVVTIEAVDDAGVRTGPATLGVGAAAATHFNSDDLGHGNPAKNLSGGIGDGGTGDRRLELTAEADVEVLSYMRTPDGFVTSLHDAAPVEAGVHRVAFFNPASNVDQASRLRIVNLGTDTATATIAGVDDAGAASGEVVVEIPAEGAADLTSEELESGTAGNGALGDGVGKWRLEVTSEGDLVVMSLLEGMAGFLTNLSSVPAAADGVHAVPMFPSFSGSVRQGFVRVVNHADAEAEVSIAAFDESDRDYPRLTLTIGANRVAHFNSTDLEMGNPDKGLAGSTGAGEGDWRLELTSDAAIEVLSYIRTGEGFLTSMHDVVPGTENRHRVVFFNPGRNVDQVSRLRMANAGADPATVTITATDDSGASPAALGTSIPAGGVRTFSALDLEAGAADLDGALGAGVVGKWRLLVESDVPITVMSILESPMGHLTNMSATTRAAP